MAILYQILDSLPFSILEYDFMKNAFLATLFITPLFALLGTMAVNNRMAFFSDALGHSAYTGIAIGVLLGLKNPIFSMLAFGIFLSLVISHVKNRNSASTDTVISVFSSTAMALGIVILSKHGGFAKYASFLIGDILTVTPMNILTIFILLLLAYLFWYLTYNKLLLLSVNTSLAASRGIKTQLIENIFVIMIAVAVMLSIQWVGILTINSLLILPAAAGRNIANNARQYHFYTTAIALFSGMFGLLLSFYLDTSAGATMVLVSAAIFFTTLLFRFRWHN